MLMATSWIALLALLVLARPRGMDLRELRRVVPDLVRLVRSLSSDPATAKSARIRLGLLVAYLALPFDLVPDFIPVLGYADDVILTGLVLRSVVRSCGADALDRHWTGTPTGLSLIRQLAGLD